MAVLSHFLSTSKHCVKALTLLSVFFFQHQSATHLSTESFQSWSQRKRFQMFHLSLQTGLGRPYSVARHMFFRPSQNYVQLSCHHCSRRDQSQMSETPQSFVPSYPLQNGNSDRTPLTRCNKGDRSMLECRSYSCGDPGCCR